VGAPPTSLIAISTTTATSDIAHGIYRSDRSAPKQKLVDQHLHPAFTVLIALVPAALGLWWGRDIVRHINDPTLPERLLAYRRRNGIVAGITSGVLAFTAIDRLGWSLPLLLFAKMAAAYPIRKTLHTETWSFGAYLSFFIRLLVALFGFWVLVSVMPFLAGRAGAADWIVAALLAIAAVAWNRSYPSLVRTLLRARPVQKPTLVSRFENLVKECGVGRVSLDQIDMRGGVLANAVALSSTNHPPVIITDTLVTRLDDDETIAILAHELAHIEHYNPRRLRTLNFITYTLIACGAVLAPLMRLAAPQALTVALLVWPVVLLVVMMFRVQHRQKHETASDLRAVALTGDSEALVRALTKLHVFARVPRRWETELERRSTHPSLARRIQAIRAASGTKPASLRESATFAAAGGAAAVTFHDDRLEWHEGSETTHTINYSQLMELRLHAHARGTLRLVAVDSQKRRWEMPIQRRSA